MFNHDTGLEPAYSEDGVYFIDTNPKYSEDGVYFILTNPAYSEDGVYFIDTNPKYFGVILDWLRYRKLMVNSDIQLQNVAEVADYFGLTELVDLINKKNNDFVNNLSENTAKHPVGHWVSNLIDSVDAMSEIYPKSLKRRFRIVQFPDGLKITEDWSDGKCLVMELFGRTSAWIETTVGKVPHGAVSVEAYGGERRYVGKKVWKNNGGKLFNFDASLIRKGAFVVQVGYVNNGGLLDITYSAQINLSESTGITRPIQPIPFLPLPPETFEILCII